MGSGKWNRYHLANVVAVAAPIQPVSIAECKALEVALRSKHSPYFTRARVTREQKKAKRAMARASRRANRHG